MTPIQTPNKPYTLENWQQGYESQREESAYWIEDIEGEIPPNLQGTLFRNGPGLLDINGQSIQHPFDGDGMVCAFTFTEGKVYFRNRFVRTEGFLKEQETGKISYRGVFGTAKPGGWLANAFDLKTKNPANTSVMYWGEKLLALWEGGKPYRLDPVSLETLGMDNLDGILEKNIPFSAHCKIDPCCEWDGGQPCLVNFGLKVSNSTEIHLFELSPQGQLLRKQVRRIPGFAFIHDFVLTPHYYVFFQKPAQFNPIPFLLGLRGAAECIKYPPKPTKMIVIPRRPSVGEEMQVLEVDAGFVFHHCNGFERDRNTLILDSICYTGSMDLKIDGDFRDFDFEQSPPSQLWRFTLNLQTQQITRELLNPRCVEFPAIHPQRVGRDYRYAYFGATHQETGNAPLQGILKLDHATQEQQFYSFAPKGFVGEPIFVPFPDSSQEDEGWLLVLVYDSEHHRSSLVILDAQNLHQGALAKIHLRYHIPYGLHGHWTPVCCL